MVLVLHLPAKLQKIFDTRKKKFRFERKLPPRAVHKG